MSAGSSGLRARVKAGEVVISTFVKTPAPQVIEVLGHAGLDFVIPDQEHAPIGIDALEALVLAGRAVGLPVVPRCWGQEGARISPLFDMGCTGVMVPHVDSAATAERVLDAVKFARGKRGVSPSPRSGHYGTIGLSAFVQKSDEESLVIAQIEDAEALDRLEEIAAVPGIDVLFVGPADLSQSLGVGFPSAELDAAIETVIAAAKTAGKAAGLFVGDEAQIPGWVAKGVTVFTCGSDQGLLLKGARRILAQARG